MKLDYKISQVLLTEFLGGVRKLLGILFNSVARTRILRFVASHHFVSLLISLIFHFAPECIQAEDLRTCDHSALGSQVASRAGWTAWHPGMFTYP